jgi:hypothetical protein
MTTTTNTTICTMARCMGLRIRQGNLIRLGSDEEDDPDWKPRPPMKYY